MANPYRYKQLADRSHIRLIRLNILAPGSNENLHMELLEANLNDQYLQFEALSYTWLDPRDRIPVYIQGQILSITANLHRFLKHLRDSREKISKLSDVLFWADQICINQSDTPERNSQVALMAEIYRRSCRTQVWLGEVVENMGPTLDLLRDIDKLGFTSGESLSLALSQTSRILDEHLERETGNVARSELLKLMDRTWFTRAWIIQEVVLAAKCNVRISSHIYRWDTLDLTCLGFAKRDKMRQGTLYGSPVLQTKAVATIRHINYCRKQWISKKAEAQHGEFLQVLRRLSSSTQCSDPRDRVYAFLALQPAPVVLRADYSLSVEDVYINVTAAIAEHSAKLDIFAWTRYPPIGPESSYGHVPSWAIDWRMPNTMSQLPVEGNSSFCACGNFTYKRIRSKLSNKIMLVRGKVIDTISSTSMDRDFPKAGDSFELLKRLARSDIIRRTSRLGKTEGLCLQESLYHRVIRVLLCYDRDHDGSQSVWEENIESVLRSLEERQRSSKSTHSSETLTYQHSPEESTKALSHTLAARLNRRSVRLLYRTADRDLFGLAPPLSQEGDLVCVLHGSNTPVILRKSTMPHQFHVMGQTYLENWMHGDYIDWEEDHADILELV